MLQKLKNIIERQWSDCTVSLSLHPNLAIKPIRFLTLNWVICVFFSFAISKLLLYPIKRPLLCAQQKHNLYLHKNVSCPYVYVCVCTCLCTLGYWWSTRDIFACARARLYLSAFGGLFYLLFSDKLRVWDKVIPLHPTPNVDSTGRMLQCLGRFFFVSIYKPRQRKKISPKRKSLRAAPSGKINAAALSIQLLPERWKLGW